MKQKTGRKSQASLQVVQGVSAIERQQPPVELTEEQFSVWNRVDDAMPADHFGTESVDLLVSYCRHVVSSKRVAEMIYAAEADSETSLDDLDKLYKMQEREGRAASSLATRLKITPQALTNHRGNKAATRPTKKPWQT